MWLLALPVFFVLGVLSLRGARWAYITFVLLGLFFFPVFFPARVGFRLDPHPCELTINIPLAIHSLTNWLHIVLFALFFVMTSVQLRMSRWSALAWVSMVAIVIGVLLEVGQGVTGIGHCRLQDLIPDAAGAVAGSVVILLLNKIGWRPHPSWTFVGRRR